MIDAYNIRKTKFLFMIIIDQVGELKEDVNNTKKKTEKLRDDVDKQEVRVTQVEYIADDTVDKVQEIDKKASKIWLSRSILIYCSISR